MFRIRGMGAVIGAMFLASSSSNAVAAAVNAEASVSTISPCPSFCGGFGGAFDEDFQGGPGVDSASSNLNNSDGNGTAQAELNGPTQLPVLRADAQSHATAPAQRSSMVQAVGTAMRHYIYNGPSTNVDLNLSLHGRATAVNPSDALLQAQVLAYRGPDLENFSASFDALFFEIIPLTPGLSLLDQKSLTVPTNAGVQTVNGTLSLIAR